MIPETDDICNFNWISGKCNPKCICGFKPKLGDYSPSRSCRLLSKEEMDSNCDNTINDIPWIIRTTNKMNEMIGTIRDIIKEKAPSTDNDCSFSWKNFKCEPEHMCKLKYKLGDYSINRVCRLRYGDTYNEDDEEVNLHPIGSLDMDHSHSEIESEEDDEGYVIDDTNDDNDSSDSSDNNYYSDSSDSSDYNAHGTVSQG